MTANLQFSGHIFPLESQRCPQCNSTTNNNSFRLIFDTCGHQKCRSCFLKEEDGCIACGEETRLSESAFLNNIKNDTININSVKNNIININIRNHFLDLSSSKNPKENENISLDLSTANNETTESSTIQNSTVDLSSIQNNTLDLRSIRKDTVDRRRIKLEEIKIENSSSIVDDKSTNPNVTKKKRNKRELPDHIAIIECQPLQYRCNVCEKSFKSNKQVRYHRFCASGEKPFKCEACDKTFSTSSHYKYHLSKHSGEKPFSCDICGKSFIQKSKLQRHLITHQNEKPFVCQTCGNTYRSLFALNCHSRSHSQEKMFHCTRCSKTFTDKARFKNHVISHRGEYMCDNCGKIFNYKSSLKLHLATHSKEKFHECSECSRAFANKKDLKRHQLIHSKIRPYECSICGVGFSRKDNLERHLRNPHNSSNKARPPRSPKDSLPTSIPNDPTQPSYMDELDLKMAREKEVDLSARAYNFRPVPLIQSKETTSARILIKELLPTHRPNAVPVVVEAPRSLAPPPASNQVKVIQETKSQSEIHWKKRLEDANKKDLGINTIIIRQPSVIVNEQR